MAIETTRISATAPKIESNISRGGMVEISVNAFCATSRGWIFGFSSLRDDLPVYACSTCRGESIGSGGGGGVNTGSFNGGISARSEKLVPEDGPAAAWDIIGSPATPGVGCSTSGSTAATDKTDSGNV